MPTSPVPISPQPASASPHAADVLNHEADARFWAQTHYKVGQKLDTSISADRAMVRVWLDILAKVKAEDAQGALVITYTDPNVAAAIRDAAAAQAAAIQHVHDAATSSTSSVAAASVAGATDALNAAGGILRGAAALQPPTVSPAVAHAAATDAAEEAGMVPPRPLEHPADHPASSPAAQPANPALAQPAPGPAVVTRPVSAADAVAVAQAQSAPVVAADVHENAALALARRGWAKVRDHGAIAAGVVLGVIVVGVLRSGDTGPLRVSATARGRKRR